MYIYIMCACICICIVGMYACMYVEERPCVQKGHWVALLRFYAAVLELLVPVQWLRFSFRLPSEANTADNHSSQLSISVEPTVDSIIQNHGRLRLSSGGLLIAEARPKQGPY